MARAADWFGGFFKALIFAAVFLLASADPSRSAPSPSNDFRDTPEVLMSLQDQCLARADRSANPERMRAICIGWALLAIEQNSPLAAKAGALRAACLREVHYGGGGEIREFRTQGEALCQNLHASVTRTP